MACLSQRVAIMLKDLVVWRGRRIGLGDNGECNFVGRECLASVANLLCILDQGSRILGSVSLVFVFTSILGGAHLDYEKL